MWKMSFAGKILKCSPLLAVNNGKYIIYCRAPSASSMMWLNQLKSISLDCTLKECDKNCTPSADPNVAGCAGMFGVFQTDALATDLITRCHFVQLLYAKFSSVCFGGLGRGRGNIGGGPVRVSMYVHISPYFHFFFGGGCCFVSNC